MAFYKTIKVKNGNYLIPFNLYKCDINHNILPESEPIFYYNKKRNIHISEEGFFKLIENFVKIHKDDYHFPLCVYLLYKKFLNTKRKTNINNKLRIKIFKKYKFKCAICQSSTKLEIDHKKPVSKGGTDSPKNLQVLCKKCNILKSDKY